MNSENNNINNANDAPIKNRPYYIKKLKYGSVALAFTIGFVAIVFVANVIITAVHKQRPFMIDMTKEQVFTISDTAKDMLREINTPIEVVFCTPIDIYEKTGSGAGAMVVNCIREYQKEFPDLITIKVIDLIKNPRAKNEYTASEASSLKTTSVIINNPANKTSRILSIESFFTVSENTGAAFGFNGERQMVSAILQVTNTESPLVVLTTGHSETVPTALVKLFTDEGFTVKQIDLTQEDIDPETKILIICNPQKDFIGANKDDPTMRSEVDKVATYLNNFGNVMYFASPFVGALPEIDDLLKEYGVAFINDAAVVDYKNAIDTSGLQVSVQYNVAEGPGDELHSSIRNLPSLPKTIVPRAKPIQILSIAGDNTAAPVLTSYDTSFAYFTDSTQVTGTYNLMVMSNKMRYIDNEPKTSLLLTCGSVDFLNEGYLLSSAYANKDIILNAIRIMANRRVATGIEFKPFDFNDLDMTLEQQQQWTIAVIFVLPAFVIVVGLIVWLRRRHA